MRSLSFLLVVCLVLKFASADQLYDWTEYGYPAFWTVSEDQESVTTNVYASEAAWYVAPLSGKVTQVDTSYNFTGTVTISPNPAGDESGAVGFVAGWLGNTNSDFVAGTDPFARDYLLVDFRRNTIIDTKCARPDGAPRAVAYPGLTVSRVIGTPATNQLLFHTDYTSAPQTLAVCATFGVTPDHAQIIPLGASSGSLAFNKTGWEFNTEYTFEFSWSPTLFEVWVSVNGSSPTLEVSVTPQSRFNPENGSSWVDDSITPGFGWGYYGFYLLQQPDVTFSFSSPRGHCPANSSTEFPGICGCDQNSTIDTDHDGVVNCVDVCPTIPATSTATISGCPGSLVHWTKVGSGWGRYDHHKDTQRVTGEEYSAQLFLSPDNVNSSVVYSIDVDFTKGEGSGGFVVGYNDGDATNPDADFLLVDWHYAQTYSNTTCNPPQTTDVGLRVSRVQGALSDYGLYYHYFYNSTINSDTECAVANSNGSFTTLATSLSINPQFAYQTNLVYSFRAWLFPTEFRVLLRQGPSAVFITEVVVSPDDRYEDGTASLTTGSPLFNLNGKFGFFSQHQRNSLFKIVDITCLPGNPTGKILPGVCGCSVPDTDTDGDGVPNCIDGCPLDPYLTSPGACGCGCRILYPGAMHVLDERGSLSGNIHTLETIDVTNSTSFPPNVNGSLYVTLSTNITSQLFLGVITFNIRKTAISPNNTIGNCTLFARVKGEHLRKVQHWNWRVKNWIPAKWVNLGALNEETLDWYNKTIDLLDLSTSTNSEIVAFKEIEKAYIFRLSVLTPYNPKHTKLPNLHEPNEFYFDALWLKLFYPALSETNPL